MPAGNGVNCLYCPEKRQGDAKAMTQDVYVLNVQDI